jgi:hypothetical protein
MLNRRHFLIAGASAAAVPALGQGFYGRNTGSPPKVADAMIGGKPVRVNYYAPSMRGRKIMGDLVPFREVWCTGANWCTTITSEQAGLEIGPMKLPAGTYAIWTIPDEKQWQMILNKSIHAFHLDYDASQDIGRTKMNLKTLSEPVEQMRIELRPESGNKGTLAVMWERTEASVLFTLV